MWLKNEVKVTDYVNNINGAKYVWGKTDCISLFLNVASIMTDDDSWKSIICWSSEEEAKEAYKKLSPLQILTSKNARRIKMVQTITSDIITGKMKTERMPYAYTCIGRHFLSSTMENGVFLTRREVVLEHGRICMNHPTAWRID